MPHGAREKAPAVGFASIGAGLDFLSGHQVRAPRVLRMLALEWLWRALQGPAPDGAALCQVLCDSARIVPSGPAPTLKTAYRATLPSICIR